MTIETIKTIKESTIIVLSLFSLSGCASIFGGDSDDLETVNNVRSGNDMVSVVLDPKSFVEYKNVENAEASRTKCFESNAAMPKSDTAEALREMRLAITGGADCGAGYNDTLIAKEQEKSERTRTRWGTAKSIITGGIIGAATVKGLEVLGDIGESALDNAGNKVEVTEGSTYNGAQGQSTYSQDNSQQNGLQFEPATIESVTAVVPETEEPAPTDCTPSEAANNGGVCP